MQARCLPAAEVAFAVNVRSKVSFQPNHENVENKLIVRELCQGLDYVLALYLRQAV